MNPREKAKTTSIRLTELGERLFRNVEATQDLWENLFGQRLKATWDNSSSALKDIVEYTKKELNQGGLRNGEATLFMRDPLSDRLILEYSTVTDLNPGQGRPPSDKHFSYKDENYHEQRYCYYDLCDRLTLDSKKDSMANRKNRGLTGWVCVTGHPLKVNSERSKERLDEILRDYPWMLPEVNKYGPPAWGNHISEFPMDDPDKWSKRFLGVPFKTVTYPHVTIGVLRYSSIPEGGVLTESDVYFLESMAELVSAVKNMDCFKTICLRSHRLPFEAKMFEETGNFYEFLQFIAKAMISKIASLYVYLNIDEKPVLRLVDAYGISGFTAELRSAGRISDYNSENTGLTWQLLHSRSDKIEVFDSVRVEGWRGINTAIFYRDALGHHGITGIEAELENSTQRAALLDTYTIKLIGVKLKTSNNDPLGVLKVEFPSTFDSEEHYRRASDMEFFQHCAHCLSRNLQRLQSFASGSWFDSAKKGDCEEFAMLMNQMLQVQLIKRDEMSHFWEAAEAYAKKHTIQVQELNDTLIMKSQTQEGFGLLLQRAWKSIPQSFKEVLYSEAARRLLSGLPWQ